MEHSAGDSTNLRTSSRAKSVEVEPLTSSCGRMVCAVHTLTDQVVLAVHHAWKRRRGRGTNDWPRLARPSNQLLLDLAFELSSPAVFFCESDG